MKTKLLSLLISFFFIGKLYAQTFPIGSTTLTFIDGSRANRAVETDIYYPATAAGSNLPFAGPAGQKYPLVVFGHGFSMSVTAYQNIWAALVPMGYIVALPKTEGGLLPNHLNFGRDLAFVVTSIQSRGNTAGNLFTGRVSSTSCVMGHSMGGGCAVLAAQYNTGITVVSGLAPAETNTSAIAAASSITRPALLFVGGNDCVTPTASNGGAIYNAFSSTCKSIINILGASHCQFANSNFNCSFGESTCSPAAGISRVTQQSIVNKYLIPWLDLRLKNNCGSWSNIQSNLQIDPAVTFQQSCTLPFGCSLPINTGTSSIGATSAITSWTSTTCAYEYQVRYRKTNTATWLSAGSTANLQLGLTGLLNSTNYEWQVRSRCDSLGSVFSAWTASKKFKTLSARLNSESTLTEPVKEKYAIDFTIRPNPGTGLFYLDFNQSSGKPSQAFVYNSIGNLVYSLHLNESDVSGLVQLDLSNLPSGVYFVRLKSDGGLTTKRLCIQ